MKKRNSLILIAVLIFIIFLGVVMGALTWVVGSDTANYTAVEENVYIHDFTKNVSGYNNDVNFSIDSEQNLYWTNSIGRNVVTENDLSDWISLDFDGNLTLNAIYDNQTGFFEIPIQATNTTPASGGSASVETFEFIINATNDFPSFTDIESSYNLNESQIFIDYISGGDEEEHYPLGFNITFLDNCTLASWSNRGAGNCSLFNSEYYSTTSAKMNFTPEHNDVGTYWANITLHDNGAGIGCPHDFCSAVDYEVNKTTWQIVKFEVLSSLYLNVSNCSNSIFHEGQNGICYINITTKGSSSSLNLDSDSSLRNQGGISGLINSSWFYPLNNTNAINNSLTIWINVTPGKSEIGNWTINFSAEDLDYSESASEEIFIYVNRTMNSNPYVEEVLDVSVSSYENKVIYFNSTDNDFLIPDKNISYGGFNESLSLIVNITNLSSGLETNLDGFDIEILHMPVSGTNRTEAMINFTPDISEAGNFTINITSLDVDGLSYSELFNLTINGNHYPNWSAETNNTYIINEDGNLYLNFSMNVSDEDGDSLNFSYSSDTTFDAFTSTFNITTGEVNITPSDVDVGQHLINITVSDGALSDTMQFNFTVNNVHDNADLASPPLSCSGCSPGYSSSLINVTEDNLVAVNVNVQDDDLFILDEQVARGFYDENISVINTTIINNSNGAIVDMFEFSFLEVADGNDNIWVFRTTFTPDASDNGNYNVTFYFSEANGSVDRWDFELNVLEGNDPPQINSTSNKTLIVNDTLLFDFNATDEEDGSDSDGDLIFIAEFLSGTDFINGDEDIFNTTSGMFNFTFNDSYAGKFHINLSVNDTSGLINSTDFWIIVYDIPEITSPVSGYQFNLSENSSGVLNFTLNSSVQDNLTMQIWIDSISCSYQDNSDCSYGSLVLRESVNVYGDNSVTSWSFTPSFTDETYGNLKNLTISVFPSSSNLSSEQKNNLTVNESFKLNITHTNYPLVLATSIPDLGPATAGNDIVLNLSDYFTDYDYSDIYYQENVSFNITRLTSSIAYSYSDWVYTFSSSIAGSGVFKIGGNDSLTNSVESDNFSVSFNAPTTTTTVVQSGGGSSRTEEVPYILKLIIPGAVSAISSEGVVVPLTLSNQGKRVINDINLSAYVSKDGKVRDEFDISFTKDYFESLGSGENESLEMEVDINAMLQGNFEITVNAEALSPELSDWGKIILTVQDEEYVKERLKFVGDFLLENPECAEINELIEEANELYENGYLTDALLKANEAINACKEIVSASERIRVDKSFTENLFTYLFYATSGILLLGMFYYFVRRHKLKHSSDITKFNNKNKLDS